MRPILVVVLAMLAAAVAPPLAAEKDPLLSLVWLSGDWEGDDGGTWNEERWMEPSGGMMLGVHRDTRGGKAISFEFLRIEATSDGITYWASPKGETPTPFRMTENGPNGRRRVVFENPSIPFPSRILYWMEKDGELHARIEGSPAAKPKSIDWVWKKRR